MAPLLKGDPFYVAAPAFIWQVLFFYVPLVLMVAMSFLQPGVGGWSLTGANYAHFLDATYLVIILKSFIFAAVSGLLCFIVGYPLAYYIAFKAGRLKIALFFLLIIPFWTNFLLHVYSWFLILDRAGIANQMLIYAGLIKEPLQMINTLWSVFLLMLYCYLPFMVLPIFSSLERINPRVIEASRDLGATQYETWYHIVLPLSMPGVLSGFFLVFIPAFGEFAIPSLMGGDKFVFVGSVIANYSLGSGTLTYGSAFTVVALISLLILLGTAFFARRIIRRLFLGDSL